MSKVDKDSPKAIIGMRMELDFDQKITEIIDVLNQNRTIVLATAANNRVTARTIDFANNNLEIFFSSWNHNKKLSQIKENANVALVLNNIQIEGKAEILGQFGDEKNKPFLAFYEHKFPPRYVSTFTTLPQLLLVKVTPVNLVCFTTIDNRFHLQNFDLSNRKVHQMRLEDRDHPHYPY